MSVEIFSNDDLVEIIRLSKQEKLSSRAIADKYDCSKSTINHFLAKDTYKEFWASYDEKKVAGGSIVDPITHRKSIEQYSDRSVFILTSAQNNTYVHSKFLENLERYATLRNAKLIVGTFTYAKNQFQNLTKDDTVWYDPKIREYIINESVQLADGLVWSGELNILPTAVNPLSGLTNYTNDQSCIVPHAKVQLESVPTDKFAETKMMYTTGCVTQSNYIEKKAGQKASHHHIYGAIIVEVDKDGTWFVRQISAERDTGNFYDLEYYVSSDGYVLSGNRVRSVTWGDIHIEKLDMMAGSTSFDIVLRDNKVTRSGYHTLTNMYDTLKPEYSFFNDIIDFKPRNHHNRNDPLFKIKMLEDDTERVDDSIKQCTKFLKLMERDWCQSVVVNSNHDAALQKWAVECDWKDDPINARFLLWCQLALVDAVHKKQDDYCLFEDVTKMFGDGDIDDVRFLQLDESFTVDGIENGFHGHTGNNGARGSINSYRVAGIRYNIGHGHRAEIRDGVFMAGVTGSMDMDYNIGMSSWSHSHIVQYLNAKRTIITVKEGKYRAKMHKVGNEWFDSH